MIIVSQDDDVSLLEVVCWRPSVGIRLQVLDVVIALAVFVCAVKMVGEEIDPFLDY